MSCGRTIRSKSLLLPPGLRPCSLMRMLSQLSELPFLIIHIRLICPAGRQDTNKTKKLPKAVQNEPPSEATNDYLRPVSTLLTGQMPHIALRCLEGSTMSNLVHRRRRCARIVPIWYCCLEGSTTEDRYLTRRRILLWLQGSLFFTAKGSYFVFWGLRRSCMAGLGVAALGCCQDAS